jgi:hypothetical protein
MRIQEKSDEDFRIGFGILKNAPWNYGFSPHLQGEKCYTIS